MSLDRSSPVRVSTFALVYRRRNWDAKMKHNSPRVTPLLHGVNWCQIQSGFYFTSLTHLKGSGTVRTTKDSKRGRESCLVRIHFSVKICWILFTSQNHRAQRAVRNHIVNILTFKMKKQRPGDATCLAESHGMTDRNRTRTSSSNVQVSTFLSLWCFPKSYHVHLKNISKLRMWPCKAYPKLLS